MLLGSAVFVGLGIWFVVSPPKTNLPILNNPILFIIVGIASILFFGLTGFIAIKKLRDKSPGLIISDEGVTDNSSGVGVGFIPWSDIFEIKEKVVMNQPFINLIVKNPQDYISRQKSALKRKTMEVNYKTYKTVIGISANGLKCNFSELKSIMEKGFADYKRKPHTI